MKIKRLPLNINCPHLCSSEMLTVLKSCLSEYRWLIFVHRVRNQYHSNRISIKILISLEGIELQYFSTIISFEHQFSGKPVFYFLKTLQKKLTFTIAEMRQCVYIVCFSRKKNIANNQ